LRQNEITSPIPGDVFEGLDEMEELDLYDNRLGPVFGDEEVKGCTKLQWVPICLVCLFWYLLGNIPEIPMKTTSKEDG